MRTKQLGAFEEFERQCSYDQYLNSDLLQTGDILLFEHNNKINSCCDCIFWFFDKLISCATKSKYSHAAIVISDPHFTSPPMKGVYVLESNHETFPDAENNEIKSGVELVRLEDILKTYSGSIYWRKLNCDRNEHFFYTLAECHSVVHNRPYDIIPTDWLKAAFQWNIGNTQRKKTFWCSALVAYIYTQLGLLDANTPWTLVSPKMLGTESGIDEMDFINCTLDKEVQILKPR